MVTLFGANTPESSNICQKVEAFLLNAPKYLGARLFYSLYAQTVRIFRNALRKLALLKIFNAAHLGKRKSNSRFMKP